MTIRDWLPLTEVAGLAAISSQALRKAITRATALDQTVWRGSLLCCRAVHGRGGHSGIRYEIELSSLPPDLQTRWASRNRSSLPGPPPPAALPVRVAAIGADEHRRAIARHIVSAGPEGSAERAAAFEAMAKVAVHGQGKRQGQPVSERTLRSWTDDYEKRGLLAGRRKGRADKGNARVVAWRTWDCAMDAAGVAKDRQIEIARALSTEVRSQWASGASSVANIQLFLQAHCRRAAEAAGIALEGLAMDTLCRPPANFVAQIDRKRARLAHVKRSDAGGYAARHTPRIRRHRNDLAPLELVAGDVRHSDIMVRRPDGSLATPKVVAFQDFATNRLFTRLFLMEKGEMIRREHVLSTLRDLMQDPAWGVPRTLYLDNGSEFQTLAAADDLALLSNMVRDMHQIEMGIFQEDAPETPTGTIRSLPYNPQSKVIESIFSAFTRSIEAQHVGFIGGNRMAKKVENQGRAPVPMEGDATAITAKFQGMVDFYNAKPQQKGAIKGRSPNAAFNTAVEGGWRSIILDPREFELAFGRDEDRRVQTGGELQISNRFYRHDDLAMMVGERVRVRIPILGDGSRVVVLTDKGDPTCVAVETPSYAMRDVAGAREQQRRRRDLSKRVAKAADGTRRVDFSAEEAAYVERQPPAKPGAPLATVMINTILHNAVEAPAQEQVPRVSRNRAQLAALTEVLNRAG